MAGTLTPTPFQTVLDDTGVASPAALIYTYTAGTTTAAATYTTSALSVANANPIVADSAGRFVAYLAAGANMKLVYKTAAGAMIRTQDNVLSVPGAAVNLDIQGTVGVAVTAGQVCYLSSGAEATPLTPGLWYLTDADFAVSSTTCQSIGMAVSAIPLNTAGTIRIAGLADTAAAVVVGSTYYVSATAGAITTTAPALARVVGVADTTSTLILAATSAVAATLPNPIAQDVLFVDATYDIGKSGASRPRDLFQSRNATIGGTLGVTGATTLSSTLGVTGATTLSSTLAVTGATTLSSTVATGALTVTGNETVSGTLDVTGATTLTGGLNTPLVPAQGGTGLSSYAVGDLVYASGSTTLSTLADVATGQVLVSGGVTTAPAYSASPSLTALTYTTSLKSTTALATPGALTATQATEFASTVSGASIMGFGTTNDVSLMNRAGTVVLGVGPNTTLVNIPAALTVGTTLGVTGVTTVAAGSAAAPAIVSTTGTADTGLWFPAADTVAASTAGSERLRIDASGNVLVGQTAADGHLVVTDAASTGWGVRVLKSSAAGTPQGLQVLVGQNSSNEVLQLGTGTSFASVTNLFSVTGAGSINTGLAAASPYNNTTGSAANMVVTSGGILQRSTSSRKYKTEIHDAIHGLSELLRLRPVTYCGINDGDTVFGGLIAEEVDAIGLREFVSYNTLQEPDALAYGSMVSLAVKAIQEQQSLITALTARVAALEGV